MSELHSGGLNKCLRREGSQSDGATIGSVDILGFRERSRCKLAFLDLAERHLAQRTVLIERPLYVGIATARVCAAQHLHQEVGTGLDAPRSRRLELRLAGGGGNVHLITGGGDPPPEILAPDAKI